VSPGGSVLVSPDNPNIIRFNGATAMEPWKSLDLFPASDDPMPLQWGHGDGAVEEEAPI